MPAILISPSVAVSGSGPTLISLVDRLANELGFWHATPVSTLATTGEARRIVLANELRDDEMGGDGSWDFLTDPWLYASSATMSGVQRRIIRQDGIGWQGNMAALLVSRPFDTALVPGTTIRVTTPLPVRRHLGIKGLVECINEGLARCRIEALITFAGNGTYEYDLSAYPWLVSDDETRGIYDHRQLSSTMPAALSSLGYTLQVNGATRTLQARTIYSSSETFQLAVVVDADRLIYDGAAWSFVTTPGLVHDTDQTAAPVEWAIAFAMVKALQFLRRWTISRRGGPDKQATLAEIGSRLKTWAGTAREIMDNEFPSPLQRQSDGLIAGVGVGVGSYDRWIEPSRTVPVSG